MNQDSSNATFTTSSTSQQICHALTNGPLKRTQIIITNTSAAAVVTIAKSESVAIAGAGIVLQPNGSYIEATDGGYNCYQKQVQAVSDVAGTLAVVESYESE
jgi:hypothetical protein